MVHEQEGFWRAALFLKSLPHSPFSKQENFVVVAPCTCSTAGLDVVARLPDGVMYTSIGKMTHEGYMGVYLGEPTSSPDDSQQK